MTARRAWFKVASELARDPRLTVEDRGILVGLLGHWTDAWAREGWTPDQAREFRFGPGILAEITGRERPRSGLARLRQALGTTSARVRCDGRATIVEWEKVQQFQGWSLPIEARSRPAAGPSAHAHAPAPQNGFSPSRESDAGSPASPPWKPLLNLLAKEPGSASAKERWLAREWPLLEAEAERMEPESKRARSAAIRGIVVRWWRQEQRGESRFEEAEDAALKRTFAQLRREQHGT